MRFWADLRMTLKVALICLMLILAVSKQSMAESSLSPTVADIPYITASDKAHLLDVYIPSGQEKLYPVILMLHGSGGDKNDFVNIGMAQFAVDKGYAVVMVNYDSTLPEAYNNTFCALAWVTVNADAYHLDAQRIALLGVSFGGGTAGFVAGTLDFGPYLKGCENKLPQDFRLRGVVTDSGAFVSVASEVELFYTDGALTPMISASPQTVEAALTSLRVTPFDQWLSLPLPSDIHDALNDLPIHHIRRGEPPFLLIQGLADDTVPYLDTLNFAQQLIEQNNNVQLLFDRLSTHVVPLKVFDQELSTFLQRIFT